MSPPTHEPVQGREDAAPYISEPFFFFRKLILPLISCLLFVEMPQSDRRLRPRRKIKSLLKIGNISKLGSSHLPPVIDSAFILPREVLGSVHRVIAGLVTSCTGLTCALGPKGFMFFFVFFVFFGGTFICKKLQRVWCFFFLPSNMHEDDCCIY